MKPNDAPIRLNPLRMRCQCGVLLLKNDRVLYCSWVCCPRAHEHDPVRWERLKAMAGETT